MLPSRRPNRCLPVLAACVGLLLPACGDRNDAFAQRYPVSGQVTYNGQPLPKGVIAFVPEKGAGATGIIEDGAYALSTGGDRDGALPGKYKVTISAKEDSEATAKEAYAKQIKKPIAEISKVPRDFLANAANHAKNLVPAGYGDVRTTLFTAEVKETSNTFPFALSDADKPPEPPRDAASKRRR